MNSMGYEMELILSAPPSENVGLIEINAKRESPALRTTKRNGLPSSEGGQVSPFMMNTVTGPMHLDISAQDTTNYPEIPEGWSATTKL